MTNRSGPEASAEGVVQDVKTRANEAIGAVSGSDSLKNDGQAIAEQGRRAAGRSPSGPCWRSSPTVAPRVEPNVSVTH